MPPLPKPKFFAKAGAKVRQIPQPTKYFRNFFSKKRKFSDFLTQIKELQWPTPYLYIRARDYVRMRKTTFSDLENNIFWLGKQRFLTRKTVLAVLLRMQRHNKRTTAGTTWISTNAYLHGKSSPSKKAEAGIHLNSPLRRTTTTCRGIHAHTIIIHTLFSVSLSRVTVPKDFEHTSSLRQNMRSTLGNQEYRCKIKDNCANDQQKVHPKFIHF